MKLYPIETGNFKLDGGAMFGVVPKSIWQKTNPADAHNLIDMGARSLLIEKDNRLILIDCGLGNKQSEKYFSFFHRWGDATIDTELKKFGYHQDDITDVFFTHLHFDHCGGAIIQNDRGALIPAFKNADFWSNSEHWQWATEPNPREKASFLTENIIPIQQTGRLKMIESPIEGYLTDSPFGFKVLMVDGHTEKQMLPVVEFQGKTIVFAGDLVPTVGHIPLVYLMGYDTRPLLTMQEKDWVLNWVLDNGHLLFFQHDAHHVLASLKKTDRGIQLDKTFGFDEWFNG